MRRFVNVALILFLSLIPTAALCRADLILPQSRDDKPLVADKVIQRTLSSAQSHNYIIELESGMYVRAIVDRLNTEAALSVYDPKGCEILKSVCSPNWPTPVSIIAPQSGAYRIEIRSIANLDTQYELTATDIKLATTEESLAMEGDKAFLEGIQLLSQWKEEASRRAIREFQKALNQWQAAGGRREQAIAEKIIGGIYYNLGETDTAFPHYNNSLSLARAIKDKELEGEALNSLGQILLFKGEPEALNYFTIALDAGRSANNYRLQVHALNNTGEYYYYFKEMRRSLGFYDEASALCHMANYRHGKAQTLLNAGYSHMELGDMKSASELFEQSLSLWRIIKDPRGEALTLVAIGQLSSRSGGKQKALTLYFQAAQTFRTLGDKLGEAMIASSTGTVYSDLEETGKALRYFERALELYKLIKLVNGEVGATILVGKMYHILGDRKTSLAYLQKAVSMAQSLGERRLRAYALKEVGSVYNSAGNKKKAFDYYEQSLDFYRRGEDPRGEAYALNQVGSLLESTGDKEKAIGYFNKALELNRKATDVFGEISTLYNIARVHRNVGQLMEARINMKAALDKAETVWSRVVRQDLRASYLATLRQSYDLYIDVLMMLDEKHPDENLAIEALSASEHARARTLIEMLTEARAGIHSGINLELAARERALQQQINEKAERHINLLSAERHEPEKIAEAKKELEEAIGLYQQARADIILANPRFAALAQPRILNARAIQEQLLDPNTALLEFALGDDRSYVWVINQDSIISRVLPCRAQIEEAARHVYKLLTESNRQIKGESIIKRHIRIDRAAKQYWDAAARLSQMILAPVADALEKQRLIVVADGALQYIPFAALPSVQSSLAGKERDNKGQGTEINYRPLIIDHEITYLPSASTLAVLRMEALERERASKSLALIADPVFSKNDSRFTSQRSRQAGAHDRKPMPSRAKRGSRQSDRAPRLPFSHKEAEAILATVKGHESLIALGFDASRSRVMSEDLSQYSIVHFATHGFIDSEQPELSEILLSLVDKEGRAQNGSLRLHEIYGLKLAAELVVLSACRTALGKDVRGEGLIGLTRGFMYAGASRVIASLWNVDDAATAHLMGKFYSRMMREGLRPAAALRVAQREMFEQDRWENPYYWAAFTLQGEWK